MNDSSYKKMREALARDMAARKGSTLSLFIRAHQEEFGEPPGREVQDLFTRLRALQGDAAPGAGDATEVIDTCIANGEDGEGPPPAVCTLPGGLPRLLEAAGEALLITTDADGLITGISPGACRRLGYAEGALLGRKKVTDLFPKPELAKREEVLSKALERPVKGFGLLEHQAEFSENEPVAWALAAKSGEEIQTMMAVAPLKDQEGKAIGYLCSARDVSTERKLRQDLDQALQEASFAEYAGKELLEKVSHQIRTRSNTAFGFADLLLESKLDSVQQNHVEMIKQSCHGLMAVIGDLVDLARMESGELDLTETDFDPRELLQDVCEQVRPRLGTKPVTLSCQADSEVPELLSGDAARFRQVLINLAGNAVRHTMAGDVTCEMALAERMDEQFLLEVTVSDTGPGMGAAQLFEIFRPVRRKKPPQDIDAGDLSLPLCQHIARLMGGDIFVMSEPGRGATFRFTALFGKPRKEDGAGGPPKLLAGKKVLVVDESGQHIDRLTSLLEAARMRVVTLTNAFEAAPLLKRAEEMENPLQLMLITLPRQDAKSYEAAMEVRGLSGSYARMPLVALSRATELDPAKSAKVGFDAVVSLPVRSRALYEALLKLLGRGSVFGKLAAEPTRSLRILLADDDVAGSKLIRYLLGKAGHQVEQAKNGTEAVRMLTEAPEGFDIVLMDVEMPEMNGFAATEAIRAQGVKELPILALTAHAGEEDHARCMAAGMNDFITKPITQKNLLAALDKWARKS